MIRAAIETDIPRITQIARQNREFIGFLMNVVLKDSIQKDSLYVYEKEDTIVGFVHFHRRLDGWTTLHEIAVAKDYHHLGIGSKLLQIPEAPVRLKTTIDNKNAIAFYEKHGFKHERTEQGKKRELLVFEKKGLEPALDLTKNSPKNKSKHNLNR